MSDNAAFSPSSSPFSRLPLSGPQPTEAIKKPNYLTELNPPQRDAVLNTEGPVMIIAGAGSGKTKVLTYRIAHLLEKKVNAYNILALTFTNKAAKEMQKRVEAVVGPAAKSLWMGTFHSIFAKILRFEADKIGYPKNFTIYDTDDSKSLIRAIVKEKQLDDKVYKANIVLNTISGAKNRLISWQKYQQDPMYMEADIAAQRPMMGAIFQTYTERCFKSGAMDFDDLLYNTNVLLRDHADVLNKYQQKFQYIMVDEYQDTNISQYLITRRLAAVHLNLCVVGDDAQSIYAFRGANIQNILNFEKDYPDLKIFKLEQNYRSTQNIVNAANDVIKRNERQLRKDVFTQNDTGDLIDIIKANADYEEARLVATNIFEEKMRHNWRNNDFAILYRTNSQSRTLEEALRHIGIPYRIIGGQSFYQRKEIKDVIAYLRYTLNHNDEEAFKRIINLPKRGIGDTSVTKILVFAAEQGADIWDVINNPLGVVAGRTGNTIADFATQIRGFEVAAGTKTAYDVASAIAKESGLLRELNEDKTIEGVSRYENVQELLNGIKSFVDNEENEDKSLGAYLQQVSLLTDADNQKEDTDAVTMMTIHGSKGLEFKSVFIVGIEEDLFPSQMMLNNKEDLEEERRLFYVAITRAEKKLHLSFALSRYRFGTLKPCEPSRFLEEIDSKYLSMSISKIKEEDAAPETKFLDQFKRKPTAATAAPRPTAVVNYNHTTSANFVASDVNALQPNMRVEHPKFGFGLITGVDRNAADVRAKVIFDKLGEKTLLMTYAKLMIID